MKNAMGSMSLPQELQAVLAKGRDVIIPESREELLEIAMGGNGCDNFEVAYDIPGKGRIVEATVSRCKNGAVVNYQDIYMRRRDPGMYVDSRSGGYRQASVFGKVRNRFLFAEGEHFRLAKPKPT